MIKLINEARRLQQLAGLLTEGEYSGLNLVYKITELFNKLSRDLYDTEHERAGDDNTLEDQLFDLGEQFGFDASEFIKVDDINHLNADALNRLYDALYTLAYEQNESLDENEENEQLTIIGTQDSISMLKFELMSNGVKFTTEGNKVIVDSSPKSRTAIRLVKERAGLQSLIIK